MSTKEKLEELKKKRAKSLEGGGKERIDKIHAAGKKTARERIAALLDPGTIEAEFKLVFYLFPSGKDGIEELVKFWAMITVF